MRTQVEEFLWFFMIRLQIMFLYVAPALIIIFGILQRIMLCLYDYDNDRTLEAVHNVSNGSFNQPDLHAKHRKNLCNDFPFQTIFRCCCREVACRKLSNCQ